MKITQYLAICFAAFFFGKIVGNKRAQVKFKVYGDIKAIREFLKNQGKHGSTSEGTAGSEKYAVLSKDWLPENDVKGETVKANFKSGDKASQFILDSLKARAAQFRDKVGKDGLRENNVVNWKKYFQKLVGNDFKKHRQLSDIKYMFYPINQNFEAGKKDMLLTYYRNYGGAYRRRRKGKPGRQGIPFPPPISPTNKGIIGCETTTACAHEAEPDKKTTEPECETTTDCAPETVTEQPDKPTEPECETTTDCAPEPEPGKKTTEPEYETTTDCAPETVTVQPVKPTEPECETTTDCAPETVTEQPAKPTEPECETTTKCAPETVTEQPDKPTEPECETTTACAVQKYEKPPSFPKECKTWGKCLLSLGGFMKQLIPKN